MTGAFQDIMREIAADLKNSAKLPLGGKVSGHRDGMNFLIMEQQYEGKWDN